MNSLEWGKGLLLAFLTPLLIVQPGLAQKQTCSTANALFQKADSLILRSHFQEATPFLIDAKRLFAREDNLEMQIETLLKLDEVYDMTYRPALREANLALLLEMSQSRLPENHPLVFKSLLQKGDFLNESGRADSARYILKSLVEPIEQASDFENLARCHLLLGHTYDKFARLEEAEESYTKALAICAERLPRNYEILVEVLVNRGWMHSEFGNQKETKTDFHQLLGILNTKGKLSPKDSLLLGRTYYACGYANWMPGDYEIAQANFERALIVFKRASLTHKKHIGAALEGMATNSKSMNLHDRSLAQVREARSFLFPATDKEMATYLQSASIVEFQLSVNQISLEDCKQWENSMLELNQRWSIQLLWPYLAISNYLGGQRLAFQALQYAKKGIASALVEFSNCNASKYDIGYSYYTEATYYYKLNEMDSSLAAFQTALIYFSDEFTCTSPETNSDVTQGSTQDIVLKVMDWKGYVFQKKYDLTNDPRDLELAFETYLRGIEIAEALRDNFSAAGTKVELSSRTMGIFQGFILAGHQLWEKSRDPALIEQLFLASEKAKNLLLLEQQSHALGNQLTSRAQQKQRRLKREIALRQRLILQNETEKLTEDCWQVDQWKLEQFDLKRELSQCQEQAGLEKDNFGQENMQVSSISDLQKQLLEPGDLLLEYFRGGWWDNHIYLFGISQRESQIFRIPCPSDYQELINNFHKSTSDFGYLQDSVSSNFELYTQSATRLYDLLLKPALKSFPKAKNLIVIPGGDLSQLPFEAFLSKCPEKGAVDFLALPYLLHNYVIQYAPSASVLLEAQSSYKAPAQLKSLAIAPSYAGQNLQRSSGNLTQLRDSQENLRGAQKEVHAIAEMGIPGTFLFGDSATEANFKSKAQHFNLLHLAQHGHANSNDPDKSHLRFTEVPGDSSEDHMLHAYELGGIGLKAELVVLSSCESGIGKSQKGEGSMSLGREFMANGAASVLSTLWKVEDMSSSQLMQNFYRHLGKEKATGLALHHAKLDLLSQADSKTAHPFFWAGYVLNGASRPLSIKGRANTSLLLLALAAPMFALALIIYIPKSKGRNPMKM